jgi:hypothetical protein
MKNALAYYGVELITTVKLLIMALGSIATK